MSHCKTKLFIPDAIFYTSLKFRGCRNRLQYFTWANFSRSPDFRLAHNPDYMPNEDGGRRDHSSFLKMSGGFKLKYTIEKADPTQEEDILVENAKNNKKFNSKCFYIVMLL